MNPSGDDAVAEGNVVVPLTVLEEIAELDQHLEKEQLAHMSSNNHLNGLMWTWVDDECFDVTDLRVISTSVRLLCQHYK